MAPSRSSAASILLHSLLFVSYVSSTPLKMVQNAMFGQPLTIDITMGLHKYPLSLKDEIPIDVTLFNNDLSYVIEPGAKVIFDPNSHTKRAVLTFDEAIPFGKSSTRTVSIPVQLSSTFRDLPEHVTFQLIDVNGTTIQLTSNAATFRSDMFTKGLIDWTPEQLVSHSWKRWIPSWLRRVTPASELVNVCFFGIVGSGKSTTQNTLMSALLTGEDVETMRPTGGGGEHVTLRIEGIDLTQSQRRMNVQMKFWDTFGLNSLDNWPEAKFRQFLQGRLTNYSVFEKIEALAEAPFGGPEIPTTPLSERIHVVLLFMPSEVFKNEIMFARIAESFRVAVSEGYNPLLMVTFANELTTQERENVLQQVQDQFNIAKRQVLFVPYSGETRRRDFGVDREALFVLDTIRSSAEAFLDAHPPPAISLRSIAPVLAAVLLIAIARYLRDWVDIGHGVQHVRNGIAKSNKPSKYKSNPFIEDSEPAIAKPATSETTDAGSAVPSTDDDFFTVTISHVQNSFKIRVRRDAKLKDIYSNVALTFHLEEQSIIFEDEDGIQYCNEALVTDCGNHIFVRVMTSN
eukprot:TRINITY_DN7096_c0_g1_i1.p1 TRINITY_DN7096_c0_g1~~TRINITY_DN7096_c0_g1_i1.p1  ORF type:complete len:571 (-),score=147.15 TRINITY_DN7096_c0_g1_i1:141-1853(-)